ncbi:MAG: NTP/NDP exchange transporter [Gammaproteobacteria bacterium]|nr:NTP/NDP exchange transporter [Gammaproteobacteria bacterium]
MKTQLMKFLGSVLKFPLKKGEIPKFFCFATMLMFTVYIYSILRNTKDTLILGHLGAELISTSKLWGVLPSAVIFMLFYTKLANLFSRTTIYHALIWSFIGFFTVFNFFLYPNLSHLMINVDSAIQAMPYFKYILQMIGGWPIVLFYILSELWGSVMMALMFWQLANHISTLEESRRFYPLFMVLGQMGLLLSGLISKYGSISTGDLSSEITLNAWKGFLNNITFTLIISGIGLSITLIILGKIVGKKNINSIILCGKAVKKKERLGFFASLKYIFSSKYIGLITLLIICYGASINLVEGIWKASINLNFDGSKVDIQNFFGDVQIWTAFISSFAMYVGSLVLSKVRWKTGALLTPIMILITGVLFYVFIIYREGGVIAPIILALGTTPVYLAIMFGGSQNVLSKSVKYAFFDPTKEMAYIPLDEELQTKGKAAADVIGGRLGKSMGAFIQWSVLQVGWLFSPNVSLIEMSNYFFIIFCLILGIWFISIRSLDKKFYEKVEENRVSCQ